MTTVTPVPGRRRPAGPPSSAPSGASTIKPILKTKSILGTRTRSQDDDGEELHDSPIKKRKTVIINEELNMTKTFGGKSVEDAKRDIKKALDGHARGIHQDYRNLIELFAPSKQKSLYESDSDEDDDRLDTNAPRPQHLFLYVVAMSSHVTSLGTKCQDLVRAILECAWLEKDESFSKAYIQLVAALSSAQSSNLGKVLTMMVEKFNPRFAQQRAASQVSQIELLRTLVPGFVPAVDPETRKTRLHLGLQYILDLFPAGKRIVVRLLDHKYPRSDEPKSYHVEYIDHLLALKKARPELERDIMELIFGRLVKIDVEFSLDLNNGEDETTRAVLNLLESSRADEGEGGSAKVAGYLTDGESDLESMFSDSDAEDEKRGDGPSDEEAKRFTELKNKLETVDAVLETLFEHYSPIFENPDSPKAVETFEDLLRDFSNIILPHLKSRHTQFLLFKFAMSSRKLQNMFIGKLFSLAFETNRPAVVRKSAIEYLASFTARGAKLESEQVQKVVKSLIANLNHYRLSHKNCLGPDLVKYTQYYTYFQSLLYVFCFRWKDLIDRDSLPRAVEWDDNASFVGQHLPWMEGLRTALQENIASKLNPLKCCTPFVAEEFAKLAHHLGLMYIFPKLEQNKNVQLSQFSAGHGSYSQGGALRDTGYVANVENHLELVFPFDPYQLPVSRRWLDLEDTYKTWQNIALLQHDDEESEVEHDGPESDVDDTATDDGNHA
ncbi:putative RNA polymerase I-specific transcription initiation factor rrn3 [Rhypophila sp. PSN 637]